MIVLCAALTALPAHARKNVVTTIAQIGQPLAEITAGKADIVTLMGDGVDPHLYRLTRSDVAKINRADIIFYNGLHLEAQMLDMLNRFAARKPVVGIADTLAGRNLLPWDGKTHDPHVWMDPVLWAKALQAAVDALVQHDPANAATYRINAAAYFQKLKALDARARAAVATIPAASRALVSAHDAFGYFGRAYAIDVRAIQGMSTESEAGIRKIETLVDTLVQRKITAVFVETTVSTRNVRALIEGAAAQGHKVRIGGSLYSDAMGAKGGYTGTYLGMFDHNVTTIVRTLGGTAPPRGLGGQLAAGVE
ncbi:MAG: manganese/zinc/iron transport system substrate-binding protein [Paracoccaceae bacterium]|jgi:manganese/zinc/iron transport system substrate-binding protein